MISRSFDFSACSGSAIRGSPLPGLKGLGRVPAGPAMYPHGSPFLRLSASIDRGWRLEGPDHDHRRGDPGRMVTKSDGFGHRPHVVHAADSMNLKSRPPVGSFPATCCPPTRRARRPRGGGSLFVRNVPGLILAIAWRRWGWSSSGGGSYRALASVTLASGYGAGRAAAVMPGHRQPTRGP